VKVGDKVKTIGEQKGLQGTVSFIDIRIPAIHPNDGKVVIIVEKIEDKNKWNNVKIGDRKSFSFVNIGERLRVMKKGLDR